MTTAMRSSALLLGFCLLGPLDVAAQPANQKTGECATTDSTDAATKPKTGEASGTDPGSSGSTGWTGGTGGSTIGTAQDGSTSGTKQPETVTGVDPKAPADTSTGKKC